MTDEGFQNNIDGPFISLPAVLLCHSLPCGRTGICIDNRTFTSAPSGSKKNNM